MNNIKNKRRANLILHTLVKIINEIIQNNKIGYINLTDIDLSNDLSFCTVYYSVLYNNDENLSLVSELLEFNKKEIRMKLAEQIRNMKKIPNLIFKYDNSIKYGSNIDKILDDIKT